MERLIGLFLGVLIIGVISCSTDATLTTPSGYAYEMHRVSGGAVAAINDYCFFDITVRTDSAIIQASNQNGGRDASMQIREDNSSYGAFVPVADLLRIMSIGDSATLYYPIDSFPAKPPGFENEKHILYEILLTNIMSPEEFQAYNEEEKRKEIEKTNAIKSEESTVASFVQDVYADYKAGNLENTLKSTASGLKYVVHELGEGAVASVGERVEAMYYGVLEENGVMFDNAWKRGRPFGFTLGRGEVIRGWDEGFALLPAGSKATLFVPYTLGYGAGGNPPTIPAKADLIFYVEFL